MDPLPRGPFSAFAPHALTSPPSPQPSFSFSTQPSSLPSAQTVAPPSPPCSADSSFQDSSWPDKLSQSEILSLVAPRDIRRKPPLQQLCGQKRRNSLNSELDDQREKHRIAEGNRRKNLSQLHRELDARLHDFFLVQAGWNPGRNLPQSKEHIVQATIYLIDFMHTIVFHLMSQEGDGQQRSELPEKLQPQLRCMQLQQLVSSLQQQNQSTEQQLQAARQEKQALEERNRILELQLKSHDPVFQTPKSEAHSPQPLSAFPESKPKETSLPGVRDLCDDIDAASPKSTRRNSWVGSSQSSGQPLLAGPPPSLSFLPSSFSPPSWRES